MSQMMKKMGNNQRYQNMMNSGQFNDARFNK